VDPQLGDPRDGLLTGIRTAPVHAARETP